MGILIPLNKWVFYAHHFTSIKHFRSFLIHFTKYDATKIYVDSVDNPTTATLTSKHFAYITGNPLTPHIETILTKLPNFCYLLVPHDEHNRNWKSILLTRWKSVKPRSRWAFSSEKISMSSIQAMKRPLQQGFILKQLSVADKNFFDNEMSESALIFYKDLDEFLTCTVSFGIIDVNHGILVSLCSGYPMLDGEDEIDIRTRDDSVYRHKGLGTAVALALMEHSIHSNKKPVWDAQNLVSRDMALRLGFTNPTEYYVYDCKN